MDRLKATSQIVDNLFKSMKKKKQAYGLSFVSSIVNEFIKTISSRFIYLFIYLFIYERILSAQKRKSSENQPTKQK